MSSGTITSTGIDISKSLRLRSYTFSTNYTTSDNSYNVDNYSLIFVYANQTYSALVWIIDPDNFYIIQCGFSSTYTATASSSVTYQNMALSISDSVFTISIGSGTSYTFNIAIYCFSD